MLPSTISYIISFFKENVYRVSHWESWHWFIKYIPILPVWLWLCWKARSFWFFTASNPTLTFGGFDGERKSEMYAQLPPGTFPRTICVAPTLTFAKVVSIIKEHKFAFPFAVKPDIGKMGLMF